jgi:hypothetical protein
VRDDFQPKTKTLIAGKAGYRCSNSECRKPTIGSDAAQIGITNLGVAAHITAAAAGGPRFNPNLTPEERRHESNGIWLCQNCAKLIDSDLGYFTVELLLTWKKHGQERAFRDMVAPAPGAREEVPPGALAAGDPVEAVIDRLQAAATTDLAGFQRTAAWPRRAVALNLRIRGQNGPAFTIARIPEGLESRPRFASWRRRAPAKQPRCSNSPQPSYGRHEQWRFFCPWANGRCQTARLSRGCAPARRSAM